MTKIVTAFLCERAGYEKDGKPWAQGIGFFGLSAAKYPLNVEVYLVLIVESDASEMGHKHRIDLEIQNADGKRALGTSSEFIVSAENRRFINALPIPLTILKPGLLQCVVKLGTNTPIILPLEFLAAEN